MIITTIGSTQLRMPTSTQSIRGVSGCTRKDVSLSIKATREHDIYVQKKHNAPATTATLSLRAYLFRQMRVANCDADDKVTNLGVQLFSRNFSAGVPKLRASSEGMQMQAER